MYESDVKIALRNGTRRRPTTGPSRPGLRSSDCAGSDKAEEAGRTQELDYLEDQVDHRTQVEEP